MGRHPDCARRARSPSTPKACRTGGSRVKVTNWRDLLAVAGNAGLIPAPLMPTVERAFEILAGLSGRTGHARRAAHVRQRDRVVRARAARPRAADRDPLAAVGPAAVAGGVEVEVVLVETVRIRARAPCRTVRRPRDGASGGSGPASSSRQPLQDGQRRAVLQGDRPRCRSPARAHAPRCAPRAGCSGDGRRSLPPTSMRATPPPLPPTVGKKRILDPGAQRERRGAVDRWQVGSGAPRPPP